MLKPRKQNKTVKTITQRYKSLITYRLRSGKKVIKMWNRSALSKPYVPGYLSSAKGIVDNTHTKFIHTEFGYAVQPKSK